MSKANLESQKIATGLSSTLNGMKLACDMVGMPVTLIDTKGTASNHRYLIRVAKTLIDEGKDISEIESILTSMVEESGTLIMAPNLDHLKKGGRITLGGKIDTLDKVRTVKKANLKIIDYMVDVCGINNHDYIIAIEHVLVDELAQSMKQILIERIGKCQIIVRELPAVVGAHMGVGGVGYQFIKKYGGLSWNE